LAQDVKRKATWQGRAWKYRGRYLLAVPSLAATALFSYYTMYGLILAFKDYDFQLGIMGSPWVRPWYFHFESLMMDELIWRAVRNTLIMSVWHLTWGTVAVVTLALLFNELRNLVFKRVVQTISYLPHFLSWVVVAALARVLFTSQNGVITELTDRLFGFRWLAFTNPNTFRAFLYGSSLWKSIGFGTIIYLAAMAGVSPELHESAVIDGANRFQRMWHITLTSIRGIILLLFILACGGILSGSFDQVFNMMTAQTRSTGEILDVWIFNRGIAARPPQFELATAVGGLTNVIGLVLIVVVNTIAKWFGEDGIF